MANESSSCITPQNPVPGGRCGSFSFPRLKQTTIFHLDTKWPCHPTMAWIDLSMSVLHSHILTHYLGTTQWHMAVYICCQRPLAAVPIPAEFIIFQDQQLFPLAQFSIECTFYLSFTPHDSHIKCTLESWGHQLQQWCRALSGPICQS